MLVWTENCPRNPHMVLSCHVQYQTLFASLAVTPRIILRPLPCVRVSHNSEATLTISREIILGRVPPDLTRDSVFS